MAFFFFFQSIDGTLFHEKGKQEAQCLIRLRGWTGDRYGQ